MFINNDNLISLLDIGSDMCLMRAGCYIKMSASPLKRTEIQFTGVSAANNTTLGEFDVIIHVDGDSYPIKVQVVSDMVMRLDFIMGTDFLNLIDIAITGVRLCFLGQKEV